MNISVILGHPDTGSFNHAIAKTVVETLEENRHQVRFHDLQQENFPSVIPAAEIPRNAELPDVIRQHCEEIAGAEGIIIIHPNWWGQPPAILKGWIDRIIRPGVAYEFLEGDSGEGTPKGLLKATTALVFNTSNTYKDRETTVFGDPLETIWKNCIFGLCGVDDFHRHTFRVIATSTAEERKDWLQEAADIVNRCFPG